MLGSRLSSRDSYHCLRDSNTVQPTPERVILPLDQDHINENCIKSVYIARHIQIYDENMF
jgi:hypothetical protein